MTLARNGHVQSKTRGEHDGTWGMSGLLGISGHFTRCAVVVLVLMLCLLIVVKHITTSGCAADDLDGQEESKTGITIQSRG